MKAKREEELNDVNDGRKQLKLRGILSLTRQRGQGVWESASSGVFLV